MFSFRFIACAALSAVLASSNPAYAEMDLEALKENAAPAVPADDNAMEAVVNYLQANVLRDVNYVFANSIDLPKGSYVGMGSGTGKDFSLEYAAGHLAGLKPVSWEGLSPEGYMVGNMAWFTDLATAVLPDGRKVLIRITVVMRKVGEQWYAVHHQVSEGVSRSGIKKEE